MKFLKIEKFELRFGICNLNIWELESNKLRIWKFEIRALEF